MNKVLKTALYILPILTLILGWQLGVNSNKLQVQQIITQLETSFNGTSELSTITDPEQDVDLALFWTVWRKLLQEYNQPENLDAKKMLYGAVSGMVRAGGDPYTLFMTPQENSQFRDTLQGNLEGIGAELTFRDELLTVVAPLKGSPAKQAGIRPNDIIIEVDGVSTEDQSLDELVQKIRGPEGTAVVLTIARPEENDIVEIEIIRAAITVPSTEYEVQQLDGKNIGYIAINQFGEQTTREVEAGLQSFATTDLSGLIIDMRYNGGGYLDKSIDIASMFMTEGKVLAVDRRGEERDTNFVHGRPVNTETPMVVLINEGSASASEIVAAALSENNRAILIGETSFGKGSIQEVFSLPGGSSVRITVAHWFTPEGKSVSEVGVTPDYTVELNAEHYENNEDPQLDAALQYLANGTVPVQADEVNNELPDAAQHTE